MRTRRVLPADKLQSHLRKRVGLGKHGDGRLRKNLITHEFRHFRGHIHIGDARFGSLHVFGLNLQVADGVFQPVLHGAKVGADFILGNNGRVDAFNRLLGRFLGGTRRGVASSGAADAVPYITVTNLARTLEQMKKTGVWVVGAASEAEKSLFDVEQKGAIAWVLGGEGDGLRRLTRATCDELARIPMAGSVESLNVSVASGICLFETVRQRGGLSRP